MEYICAFDLGGFKFKIMLGELSENGLEIINLSEKRTNAIEDGKIVDFQAARKTLSDLYVEMLNMTGITAKDISSYFVNISGTSLKGYEGNNFINIEHKDHRITKEDMERVIEETTPDGLFEQSYIVEKIPKYFIIDNNNQPIHNPVNLEGQRLSVNCYVVATSKNQINNIKNLIVDVTNTRLENIHFYSNAIASATAILSDDQKDIGVILVDIGGSNTDIIGFSNKSIVFMNSFKGGGNDITKELAKEFSLSKETAETLKYMINTDKNNIKVKDIAGIEKILRVAIVRRKISEKFNEIFGKVYNKIQYNIETEDFSAGIILTGGTAESWAINEIAAPQFPIPVQKNIVNTKIIPGLNNFKITNEHSTVIGLLLLGKKYLNSTEHKKGFSQSFNLFDWIRSLFNNNE